MHLKGFKNLPASEQNYPKVFIRLMLSGLLICTMLAAVLAITAGEMASATSEPGYRLARSLSGPDQPAPDPLVLFVTSTTFKVAFAIMWIILALALYRRARLRQASGPVWLLLGLLIGPFAWIVFALRCRKNPLGE